MFLFRNIRNRASSAIAAVIGAAFFFICGAILAFVVSPQQALEWRRIQNLPQLDAASFAAADSGDEVAITGRLENNQTLTEDGMVAYFREEWVVELPDSDDDDSEPSGSWTTIEEVVPVLMIEISGGTLMTLAADSPRFDGKLHLLLEPGSGVESADYESRQMAEGSMRTQGFKDGDLLTVIGDKASTGDLIPRRLYGGDRVSLVNDIRSGARAVFFGGIAMMICAPIVLVIGVLAGLFGRRRRGLL